MRMGEECSGPSRAARAAQRSSNLSEKQLASARRGVTTYNSEALQMVRQDVKRAPAGDERRAGLWRVDDLVVCPVVIHDRLLASRHFDCVAVRGSGTTRQVVQSVRWWCLPRSEGDTHSAVTLGGSTS